MVLLSVSNFYCNLENKYCFMLYLPKIFMLIMLINACILASGLPCNVKRYMW